MDISKKILTGAVTVGLVGILQGCENNYNVKDDNIKLSCSGVTIPTCINWDSFELVGSNKVEMFEFSEKKYVDVNGYRVDDFENQTYSHAYDITEDSKVDRIDYFFQDVLVWSCEPKLCKEFDLSANLVKEYKL